MISQKYDGFTFVDYISDVIEQVKLSLPTGLQVLALYVHD